MERYLTLQEQEILHRALRKATRAVSGGTEHMTLQEFKAWFDGFTENMGEAPTKLQWARIQARVKEIDGAAITYPVFVDRYWPPLPAYPAYPWTTSCTQPLPLCAGQGFLSTVGMNALGHLDFAQADA